jgi:hypothetical protein
LRVVVTGLILLGLAGVLVLGARSHFYPGIVAPVVWLVILLVAFVFERPRYSSARKAANNDTFAPNGERFIDPTTKAEVTVYVNARGEREYRSATKG